MAKFEKGQTPWNKGTNGICKANSGSFQKGSIPWNFADGESRPSWILRARATLEQKYGISWEKMHLPKDSVIHHINGDYHDNKFDNLCVMSRKNHTTFHNKLRYPKGSLIGKNLKRRGD